MSHIYSPETKLALAAIPPPTPQYRKPRLTLGRLMYLGYYAPRGALQKGVGKMLRGWWGKRRLTHALPQLQLLETPSKTDEKIHLHALIGSRYLPEACLLAYSLRQATMHPVYPHFYDDGTLNDRDCELLKSKLPLAVIHRSVEIHERLAECLPESRFPCLRTLRPAYPHIRKLTDIHLFPGEWKLVSDADILFFSPPTALFTHLSAKQPCHMVDIAPAYGVPLAFLEELAGCPVHPKVNVGLCHLPSSLIDWEFVEDCTAKILALHGFNYYLEQALTAILLARFRAQALPAEDYVVYPSKAVAQSAQAAAIHYVDDSRAFYYAFAWQQVLSRQISYK